MGERVAVYIRLRSESDGIWSLDDEGLSYCIKDKKMTYTCFKSVFHNETNIQICQSKIKKNIQDFIGGENVTIFAYGQTGSGKTHTIFGSVDDLGIVQLALKDIFESEPENIKLSYFELFNEKVFDLCGKKELKMFSLNNEVVIKDLYVKETKCLDEALQFVDDCQVNRTSGITEFNYSSSRSHGVLKITKNEKNLFFIDLAGSERATKDKNRLVEGGYINKSLLALGKLVNDSLAGKTMLFRESKLTRILKTSFENKTDIVAICTISSLPKFIQESISTLSFASRLSNLTIKAKETKIDAESNKSSEDKKIQDEKISAMIELYNNRIENLEELVLSLLDRHPNKTTSDIYVLEKQMFNLHLDELTNKQHENIN